MKAIKLASILAILCGSALAQDGMVHTFNGFIPNGERSGFVQDGEAFDQMRRPSTGRSMDTAPPRAPEYYARTLMATTTAESIASLCPSLGFDSAAAEARSKEVLARLASDGFDTDNLSLSMADPSDQVRNLQNGFLGSHGLVRLGDDPGLVCRAGNSEITDGSEIGSFLYAVSG